MGNFGGIGATEVYEKGNFLTTNGSYELAIIKILVKDTRKSGLGFIVEFRVVEATGEGGEKHQKGSKATWFQKMTDKDIAMPAIKEFMIALLAVDKNDKEAFEEFNDGLEILLDESTDHEPENSEDRHPLFDERIHVDTYTKVTLKGQDFTVHNWTPGLSEPDEDAA